MNKLGFWVAIFTTLVTIVFAVSGVLTPPRSGPFAPPGGAIPFPYTDVAAFIPGDYWWLLPGMLLAPLFVVLIACVHAQAREDRKVFGQIGLAFAVVYATLIILDYALQWTVVIPSILAGETAGLTLITQYNPHGVFIALECLGYFMFSLALFAVAPIFSGGRLENALRWLFVADFAIAVVALFGFVAIIGDFIAFEVTILTVNWIVLIVGGILLSIRFRRRPI